MEPIKEGEEQRNDTPLTLVLEPDPEAKREKPHSLPSGLTSCNRVIATGYATVGTRDHTDDAGVAREPSPFGLGSRRASERYFHRG